MIYKYSSVLNRPVSPQLNTSNNTVVQQDRWVQRGEYIYNHIIQPSRNTSRYNTQHNICTDQLLIECYDFTKHSYQYNKQPVRSHNINTYINNLLSKYQHEMNPHSSSNNISSLHSIGSFNPSNNNNKPLTVRRRSLLHARDQRRHKLKSKLSHITRSPYRQRGYVHRPTNSYSQLQRQQLIDSQRNISAHSNRRYSTGSDISVFSAFTPILPLNSTASTPAIQRQIITQPSNNHNGQSHNTSDLQTISSLSSPQNITHSSSSVNSSMLHSSINTSAHKQLFTRSPYNNNNIHFPSPLHTLMPLSEESSETLL